jgi:RNA polymerase sigma factor (sigma-70 family)
MNSSSPSRAGRLADPLSLYFHQMSTLPRPCADERKVLAGRVGELREALRQRVIESPLAAVDELRRASGHTRLSKRLGRLLETWTRAFEALTRDPAPHRLSRLERSVSGLRRRCIELLRALDFSPERVREIARGMTGLSDELDGVLREIDAYRGDPGRQKEFEVRRSRLMLSALENGRDLHLRVTEIRRSMAAYEESKRELAEGNLGLVVFLARRYSSGSVPLADLIQEGNVGLMKAADRFDPSLGYRFSTYAKWWIREAIGRALAWQSGAFSIPERTVLKLAKLRSAANELAHKLGRPPSLDEISGEAGIPIRETQRTFQASAGVLSIHRLPEVVKEGVSRSSEAIDEGGAWSDTRPELQSRIERALSTLPFRERQVIELRFGIGHSRAHSRTEVARLFRLTQERIRQIEETALKKLREPLRGEL